MKEKLKLSIKERDNKLLIRIGYHSAEELNSEALTALEKKYIRGLLRPKTVSGMLSRHIEYSGPLGITIEKRMESPINKLDFFLMIEMLVDLVKQCRKNGLNIRNVALDQKHVFYNRNTRELMFLYLPFNELNEKYYIDEFIRWLIYNALPNQNEDREAISKFSFFFNALSQFNEKAIEDYVMHNAFDAYELLNSGLQSSQFLTDKPLNYLKHKEQSQKDKDSSASSGRLCEAKNEEKANLPEDDEATGLLEDDEATGLLEDDEATGLLEEESPVEVHYCTLYRSATQESILLKKSVTRFGKDSSSADYVIANNPVISRIHADFVMRGSACYLIDLNSKNHCYINGTKIPSNEEIPLHDGDIILLANEEFIFYC